MKALLKSLAIPAAVALLAVSAQATSQSFISAGTSTSGTPGYGGAWHLITPSTTNITSSITLHIPASGGSGGGASSVSLDNQPAIVNTSAGGNSPGTYSDSDSASNQPAGDYYISQSWGGSPGINGNITTTLSW